MRVLFVVSALLASVLSKTITLAGTKPGREDVGLIFVQGAMLAPDSYLPLITSLQAESDYNLFVVIPQFPFDFALPVFDLFRKTMASAEQELFNAGLQHSAPLFMAGHSLGASTLQDYVAQSNGTAGQILMGASLSRKFRDAPYPVPTYTLNGELDGMYKPLRVAEAFYHKQSENFPFAILEGVTHMQFASGKAPGLIKRDDLRPEQSPEAAHLLAAQAIADFLAAVGFKDKAAWVRLAEREQATAVFLAPLLAALKQEGSYYIKKPCNSDHPAPHCPFYPAWPLQDERTPSTDTDCFCGVPWVEQVAVPMMAGLPGDKYPVVARDAPHDVTDTKPYHHAHLWNDCTNSPLPCTLNLTSVSQAIYDRLESLDTGFTHASAAELRVKMKSRQSILMATVDANATLAESDFNNVCAEINAQAYQWALDNAGEKTRARFAKYGQRMVFGDDIVPIVAAGPLWIYHPLEYKELTLAGERVLQVRAPTMRTDVTAHLYPDSAGYHYCKLLSPARAMEWIYSYGLRLHYGLSNL